MKKALLIAVLLSLLISLFGVSTLSAQAESVRYVINFKTNRIPANAADIVAAAGGQLVRTLPQVGIGIAVSSDPAFADVMGRISSVQSVGEVPAMSLPETQTEVAVTDSGPTANDDLYGIMWGLRRVRADQAWAAGITGSHDTVVAIIDTGIASNHPDLAPNLVFSACYTSEATCLPYPSLSDHGTHVAGTVAAVFGGGRVVGVGPNLGLAGYNVFENIPGCGVCAYSDSRWAAMIDAAERGFDVINMSLGAFTTFRGGRDNATFIAADNRVANYVLNRGTTIVASAGNSGANLNGTAMNLPGGLPGIINVGATGIGPAPQYPQPNFYDTLAFYSNYGASVSLVAPGGDCGQIGICDPATRPANWFEHLILSTIVAPSPACAATQSCPVGYGWKGGTSMASPHVAGVAGLVMDQNRSLRPNQVDAILRQTAESLGDRQMFGHGMVDALAAATRR